MIFLVAVTLIPVLQLSAQDDKSKRPSPPALVSQKLKSGAAISIDYSQPSVKGRAIGKDLEPMAGKVWRTGANENTTISFSEDVTIGGKVVPKGKYALFTTPRADNWEIVFYAVTDNWGTPEVWDETKVVLKTTAEVEMMDKNVESFTISINNLDLNFAILEFYWEKTYVALKFEVPTQKMALANIEKALAGPSAGDYFSSAQYLFQSAIDVAKALEYVNKALDMKQEKPFWYLRLKSLIQAKTGDKIGAIETAKLSLSAAEIAKNQDYIKMNKASIEEWSKK